MPEEQTIPLKEYLDARFKGLEAQVREAREDYSELRTELLDRISKMDEANIIDHMSVIARLTGLEEKFTGVVTWKSLAGSIATIGGLVAFIAGVASLLGIT